MNPYDEEAVPARSPRHVLTPLLPWLLLTAALVLAWLGRELWQPLLRPPLAQTLVASGSALGARLGWGATAEPAPAAARPAPAPAKTTVYRWVDARGVSHFEQAPGPGRQALELDAAAIQSLQTYPGRLTPPPEQE